MRGLNRKKKQKPEIVTLINASERESLASEKEMMAARDSEI